MKLTFNKKLAYLLTIFLVLAVIATPAYAGSGGTEFSTVVTALTDWAQGGLGKVISLSAVIIGALFSVARTNPIPILSGVAFAMILNYTPGIINNLLTGAL